MSKNLLKMYKRDQEVDSKFYNVSHESLLSEMSDVSDMYYLAMMTHAGAEDLAIDLPLILGTDKFLKILEYYGGRTMRIPTVESIQDSLLGVMSYYYYNVKSYSWDRTLDALNVPKTPGNKRMVSMRYNRVRDMLDEGVPKLPKSPEVLQVKKSDTPEVKLIKCRTRYVSKDDYNASSHTLLDVLLEDNKITKEEYYQYLEDYLYE